VTLLNPNSLRVGDDDTRTIIGGAICPHFKGGKARGAGAVTLYPAPPPGYVLVPRITRALQCRGPLRHCLSLAVFMRGEARTTGSCPCPKRTTGSQE